MRTMPQAVPHSHREKGCLQGARESGWEMLQPGVRESVRLSLRSHREEPSFPCPPWIQVSFGGNSGMQFRV